MAALSTIGLIVAAAGAVASYSAQQDAKQAAQRSAEEQRKAQAEQKAQAAQKSAMERRQQIREERVKRARVLQSAQNTGVSGSSGEIGAIGALSTNLGNNIGINIGREASNNRASIFAQNAADFNFESASASQSAGMYSQLSGIGMNIFTNSYQPSGSSGGGGDPLAGLYKSNRSLGD